MSTLFESMKEADPRPPRQKRKGASTDSIALIASMNGVGVILEEDGGGIEASIEEVGRAIQDNGLDDAPDGLSIWEGRYHTSCLNTPDGIDYDAELIGTFRELTDKEWQRYRDTGLPWEFEPTECSHCGHTTVEALGEDGKCEDIRACIARYTDRRLEEMKP